MNQKALAKTTAVLAALVILLGAVSSFLAVNPRPAEQVTRTVERTQVQTVTVVPTRIEYIIGMPMAVTGAAYATEGPFRRDAAQLAIEDINALLERSGSPVRFKAIFEDSKGTAEGALAAVQALFAAGARVMVGPFSTGEVRGVKAFADTNKIVIISPSSTGVALALADDYVYRAVASDLFQARALAQLVSTLGYSKVAIIGRSDDYGKGIADLFEKSFAEKYKGTVRKLLYTPGQPDYGAEVLRLASLVRELGADEKTAAVIIAFDEDGTNILNNARLDPALSKTQWFGSESMRRPATYFPPKATAELSSFLVSVKLTGLFPSPVGSKNPVTVAFEEAYKKRFNKDPTPYSYYTYDSVWLAALAIMQAGKYDAEAVRKILPQVGLTYIGASGYKKLDPNGDIESADYEIWRATKVGDTYSFTKIGAWLGATEQVQLG